jgi:outer membrane protein assembly factor BamD
VSIESRFLPLCVAILLAFTFFSCSAHQSELDPAKKSDSQLYQIGVQALKDGDRVTARQAFKLVFDNFPKSEYRILAKIGYADSFYYEGTDPNYLIAIQEYQDFITLFPFSPKAEYAQVQIGMCFFNMTEKPDRDQTNTRRALEEFKKVIDNYPKGNYYKNAYDKMLESYSRLAEHDFLIGKFYQRTGKHQASVERFKGILQTFPEKVYQPKYYFGLAQSLEELSQNKEACVYYTKLLEKWPTSDFTSDAQAAKARVCTK